MLDLADVIGKRHRRDPRCRNVTIREENATAALEVMSRFAVDPQWLDLPAADDVADRDEPSAPGLLEHPAEAFAYFRGKGVARVVCEEKHMGSRAVVIVCRDEDAARRRFGIDERRRGIVYTRTGRRFFDTRARARVAGDCAPQLTPPGCGSEFDTDWFCLDCELMPWSAKAQELLRHQYAAVGRGRPRRRPSVDTVELVLRWCYAAAGVATRTTLGAASSRQRRPGRRA